MGDKPYPWTDDIESEIFDRIAKGQSVRTILVDDWLPGPNTFYSRLANDEAFTNRYLRAREAQADTIFEECLAIADSQEDDVFTRDGVVVINHDVIARAKLRIDTRMRMAGKLRPKVYGDKSVVEGPGANGEHLHKVGPDEAFQRLASRLGGIAPGSARGDASEE